MKVMQQQKNSDSMKPHQERTVKEKEELDVKILGLQKFTEGETVKSLSSEEQRDLRRQLDVMYDYSQILKKRINRF